jgi:hypothetical protein
MEEVSNAKHYIAVNAGGRYPLLKTARTTRNISMKHYPSRICMKPTGT